MATTSLKLPDDLKDRVSSAARARGMTMHAFMVEAVRQATTCAEQRAHFIADAKAARAAMRRSGKGYAASEVHDYIRARARGGPAQSPKAKPWRG